MDLNLLRLFHNRLLGVEPDQHHRRQHPLNDPGDHTGRALLAQLPVGSEHYVLTGGGAGISPAFRPPHFGRAAACVIAASEAPDPVKAQADYVCDGTDDQVEIQAAIDAMGTASPAGGLIMLSKGTFYIGATISLNNAINVSLCGQGMESSILSLIDNANTHMFHFDGASTVPFLEIKNLKLYGNRDHNDPASNGVYVQSTPPDGVITNLLLEKVKVERFRNTGVQLYGPNLVLDKVVLEGNAEGLFASISASGQNGNCKFIANSIGATLGGAGIQTLTRCVFKSNTARGLSLSGASGCVVAGSLFEGNPIAVVLENSAADNLFVANQFLNSATYDVEVPFSAGGGNAFMNNFITGSIHNLMSALFRDNRGYITENSGTATIVSGDTSVVVTHGLAKTPTGVQVTPTLLSNANKFWVTNKTSTQFTINVDGDPGEGTAKFDWRAVAGEGN